MACVTFFRYIHKDTALHRMDGRLKLLCMLILSLSASFAGDWWDYAIPFVLLVFAWAAAKLPVIAILRDMKFFAVIILIVIVTNAFAVTGDPIPYFPVESVSVQGVVCGLRFAGRLILILMVGTIMAGTTSLLTLKNVIEWYLRPVPFVPEVRVATMINLTFVFIPVIFDSYTELMDAQRSRCVELRKNPVKRISFLVSPLLGRALKKTDEIICAMESRCYSEVRTRQVFKTNKADWLILAVCLAVFCVVIF